MPLRVWSIVNAFCFQEQADAHLNRVIRLEYDKPTFQREAHACVVFRTIYMQFRCGAVSYLCVGCAVLPHH